jgi:hypothetical protein
MVAAATAMQGTRCTTKQELPAGMHELRGSPGATIRMKSARTNFVTSRKATISPARNQRCLSRCACLWISNHSMNDKRRDILMAAVDAVYPIDPFNGGHTRSRGDASVRAGVAMRRRPRQRVIDHHFDGTPPTSSGPADAPSGDAILTGWRRLHRFRNPDMPYCHPLADDGVRLRFVAAGDRWLKLAAPVDLHQPILAEILVLGDAILGRCLEALVIPPFWKSCRGRRSWICGLAEEASRINRSCRSTFSAGLRRADAHFLQGYRCRGFGCELVPGPSAASAPRYPFSWSLTVGWQAPEVGAAAGLR